MALIVEDGSVVANAESYVSVATADLYWSARNNSTWSAASEAQKEAALREATQFLDGSYRWSGTLVNSAQALAWPRVLTLDKAGRTVSSSSVPNAVKSALCELALEALSGRLMASLERGGMVQSESLGPLAVTYFPGAPGGKRYPFISLLVKDYADGAVIGALTIDAVRG